LFEVLPALPKQPQTEASITIEADSLPFFKSPGNVTLDYLISDYNRKGTPTMRKYSKLAAAFGLLLMVIWSCADMGASAQTTSVKCNCTVYEGGTSKKVRSEPPYNSCTVTTCWLPDTN
jgi:hypothetical protein